MIDHDASHQRKMIMSYRYSYFFEDLAQSQQGKAVRIEKGGAIRTTEVPGDQAVLEGLKYSHSPKGETVIVSTSDPDQPELKVGFNLVWVIFDREDKVVAVELSDEHNRKVVMRFGSN
jgi:hypothetical protein